jgi:hypothetical protein
VHSLRARMHVSENSALLVNDLSPSDGQCHMSEGINITGGIAFQKRQVRVHPRFDLACGPRVAETCSWSCGQGRQDLRKCHSSTRHIAKFLCQSGIIVQIADICTEHDLAVCIGVALYFLQDRIELIIPAKESQRWDQRDVCCFEPRS